MLDYLVNLLCQKEIDSDEFYWLRIPTEHFRKHEAGFSIDGNRKINLIINAAHDHRFKEMRGSDRSDLSEFVQQ